MATPCATVVARLGLLAVFGVVVAHTAACSEDFTPRYVVDKTRILAVRASVPRIDVGESTRLSALVASDVDDDEFERLWEVCPFTRGDEEGYVCDYPSNFDPELTQFLRSTDRTFDLFYPPQLQEFIDQACEQDPELVDQIPEGIGLPDCSSGFPLRVRLQVNNPRTGEEVIAVKTVYLLPSDASGIDASTNSNPRIAELAADPDPGTPEQPVVGQDFKVRCLVDEESLDDFVRFDEDEARAEEIQLSWYVRNPANADGSHPRLEDSRTFFSLVDGEPDEAQRNEVTARTEGPVTVWCVIRDGRGGTDWKQLDLTATP